MIKNKKLLVAMILTVVLSVVYFVWGAINTSYLSSYLCDVIISLLPCAALLLSMNGQRKKAIVCAGVMLALAIVRESAVYGIVAVVLLLFLCLKNKNRWDWIGVGVAVGILLLLSVSRYDWYTEEINWDTWYGDWENVRYIRYTNWENIIYCISQIPLAFVCLFGFADPHHEFTRSKSIVATGLQAAYKRGKELVNDPTRVTAFIRKVKNNMFTNIGGKIKTLTKVICWIGIAASVIGGVVCMADDEVLLGLAVIVGGALASWLGSFFTYGFGELVENVTVIAELNAKADAEKQRCASLTDED